MSGSIGAGSVAALWRAVDAELLLSSKPMSSAAVSSWNTSRLHYWRNTMYVHGAS